VDGPPATAGTVTGKLRPASVSVGSRVYAGHGPGNTVLSLAGPILALRHYRGSVAPCELSSALPPTNASTSSRSSSLISTSYCSSLHVSHSPYRFLVLQPILQLPTDPHQCFGHIQEAHKERPTCTPPRRRASILQHSQCHSCCSSAATPRARSVPKKRRTVDTMA
jgi:hypothetical protein